MEKIPVNVTHGTGNTYLALGLPDTPEFKEELSAKCVAITDKFIEAAEAEDKQAYTRSHFAEDIINTFSAAEILVFAMGYFESTAEQIAKKRAMVSGLEGVMKTLEETLKSRGVDVEAMKANIEKELEASKAQSN